ncbi:MAG: type I restriction enzyme HsdR N-terminal domain-containing protein [Saprospiraceae bacterium]|nr:type I restriction enzyme HsdR N-terminal domain-containing protein [Saprospiraceae bacterium]
MIDLNLLDGKDFLKVKPIEHRSHIWDPVRKKWIRTTPEEIVRQLLIHHLISQEQYPKGLIKVEKKLRVNTLSKRCDILVLNKAGNPFLLVECKAPNISISQSVFEQVAIYNLALEVPYLLVTNGRQTFCCSMDYEKRDYRYLNQVPKFGTYD